LSTFNINQSRLITLLRLKEAAKRILRWIDLASVVAAQYSNGATKEVNGAYYCTVVALSSCYPKLYFTVTE